MQLSYCSRNSLAARENVTEHIQQLGSLFFFSLSADLLSHAQSLIAPTDPDNVSGGLFSLIHVGQAAGRRK